MRLPRANPHLRPKPVPEPIRKPRTRIHKHPRTVHSLAEPLRVPLVLRHDRVRVVRAVRVDVLDRGRERGDGLDGERELEELGLKVGGGGGAEELGEWRGEGGEGGEGRGVAAELDVVADEGRGERGPEGGEERVVDEERFGRVAGGGVGRLWDEKQV